MAEFTAYQASVLADDVYTLTRLNNLDQAVKYLQSEYNGAFNFAEQDIIKGKTGGPGIIKCRTAFGVMLLGQDRYKGHAVILFRGTQYLADWLTNLNISVSSSASGQPVHDGFNSAFKTMESQIRDFVTLAQTNQVHTFHCVGHSLGGALATLCGDWLHANYKHKAYVYTYGSPRVGLQTFATTCTNNLGESRIFRVYHRTDIVPCIPIWPYIHTPNSGRDYYLPSPGMVPMAEYHGMNHYMDSVKGQSWNALGQLRENERTDSSISQWLKQNTPLTMTITTIQWLNDALVYVLKKCVNGAAWMISQSFCTGFTLLDQLAYILEKGVNLATTVSDWVVYLMRRIMQVLGMKPVVDGAELTRDFIRRLLMRLHDRIHQYTQAALNQVMVNGRAI